MGLFQMLLLCNDCSGLHEPLCLTDSSTAIGYQLAEERLSVQTKRSLDRVTSSLAFVILDYTVGQIRVEDLKCYMPLLRNFSLQNAK